MIYRNVAIGLFRGNFKSSVLVEQVYYKYKFRANLASYIVKVIEQNFE